MILRSSAMLLVAVVVAGCIGFTGDPTRAPDQPTASPATARPTASPAPGAVELTIFAAASLRTVLEKIKSAYEAANPGTTVTISTDSSAALRTKIEQGAPADVFLSADTTNAEALVAGGFATDDIAYFAGTTLVVVTPRDNPGAVTSPFDLAKRGLRIIAAGDDVPISRYAQAVVGKLAEAPGAPIGFAAAYAANVVSKEDNVRAVLAKIELGEGDAALVYETDARASGTVATIGIPFDLNTWAIYAGVVLRGSPRLAAAQGFLSWLRGRDAGAYLVDAGFFIPPA